MSIIIKDTLAATFLERVKTDPDRVGFQFKPTYSEMGPVGQWKQFTFKQHYQESKWISCGLMSMGVQPGDRVSIQSTTRVEWSMSDIAIQGARAIIVPVYPSLSAADSAFILEHAESKVLFVEDSRQLQKMLDHKLSNPSSMPALEKIVVFDSSAMQGLMHYGETSKMVLSLQALIQLGKREDAHDPMRFDRNLQETQPSDILLICYTSGTTGVPKGVMLTHEGMMSLAGEQGTVWQKSFGDAQNDVNLSFVPMSHIMGQGESALVFVNGWRQVFAEGLDKVVPNLKEIRPHFFCAVPGIFEKARSKILAQADGASPAKRKLFYWSLSRAQLYFGALRAKRRPTLRETSEYVLARKLVLDKVGAVFGGRVKAITCGGAPLSPEIAEFFQCFGILILETFGLTETTGSVTSNVPLDYRFGVVGKPLSDVSLKIAPDGEILIKSKQVFKGYYKAPAETAEVLKDGWFQSGDIGFLDEDGFLHITDRKKDLIVTSGGKKVAPQKIEGLATNHKLINQFVVFGDRQNYLTALLTLDREAILKYAHDHEMLFSGYPELVKHPKILALVQQAVDEINSKLSQYETIKKFVVLPAEFTVESGELTPSFKIKRKIVAEKYKSEVESMYTSHSRVSLDSASSVS